jgi:acyl carrier protein
MSLGYYDDEAANAERFIKNPYSKTGDCSDLIFRTGDLGRVLTDGNIEILGRTDRQIKIRGFRVELDAIESELARFPAVACCAVKHFEPEDASIIIVGYYVSENEISNSELSNHLRRCLPDYMCPSGFIKIDKLPVTRNNKTDYAALLLPDILSDSDYEPPATTLECEIEKIWCEILKKSRFSMEDDFLQGGGNSLNTMTMINSIYEKYGYELPLVAVFSGITVRQLAQLLEQNVSDPGQAEMGDVEDFIIAHTKMDARYIKVISPGSELRVLFMHAALSDELLKAIRDEFDRSLHPHYIEAMCEQAVTMPDVIKISNEELITLLSLKQNYDISEIGLGELYAQNDLLNSMIMSSSTSRKREFSVAQVVRTYVPELNSTTFILHGLIDLKALERAFCDVINSEALLRCAMVNGKSFLEYPEVDETMPLPMLDLCDYTPQCCRRIISDGLMPKFLLKEFAKNDALQWRALGVKLNHSETLFYFFANHIIFDGFSRQIFKDALLSGYARHTGRSTAMVSDKTSSYFDFNDHVRRHMAEKGLPEWVIPYESFKNHSNMLRQKMNGEQSVQKITIDMRPVFAQHPDVTKDDLMAKTAYSVFTGSIAQCFRCEMIPFVTISDGRRFGEHSCYSHIGEFIDYIPYLGCNTDQDFLDYSAYLTRIEIEGVSILESLGVSSRSKISHMKLYNFMRSIPVVYNYQHYRVAESEEESSSFTDDVGPQKPSFINFIVRPRQDALEFLVVSPCKIEICTEKDGSK